MWQERWKEGIAAQDGIEMKVVVVMYEISEVGLLASEMRVVPPGNL